MKEKKGISLIVLIVTIIVMIIIAGAIIISLTETNVIDQAEVAVEKHNVSEIKSAASLAYAEWLLNGKVGGVQNYIRDSLINSNVVKLEEMNKYYVTETGAIEIIEETNEPTMIITVEIPKDNFTFTLGEVGEDYGDGEYIVEWGYDNIRENRNVYNGESLVTHTYAKKGTYDIKITGEFNYMNIGLTTTDSNAIIAIKSIENMKTLENLWINAGDKLKYVPLIKGENLFEVTISAKGIEEIPDNLFVGSPKIEYINFVNSTNLKTVSEKAFEPISNLITNIDRMFSGCTSLEGNIPEFWNAEKYPNISSHTDWLKGVDITKITNYADIPDDWK